MGADAPQGEPIHFSVRTTDATVGTVPAGVPVLLYIAGTITARTLAANEFLELDSWEMVGSGAGEHHLYLGTDGTPSAGETVSRGGFAANGGIVRESPTTPRRGVRGSILRLQSDTAVVINVNGTGRIRK